jgi:hypothetical protein
MDVAGEEFDVALDTEDSGVAAQWTMLVSVISSISSMERGEVFYGTTDWLGSCDPLTPVRYTCGSLFGLAD